jgi:hypothetical protein
MIKVGVRGSPGGVRLDQNWWRRRDRRIQRGPENLRGSRFSMRIRDRRVTLGDRGGRAVTWRVTAFSVRASCCDPGHDRRRSRIRRRGCFDDWATKLSQALDLLTTRLNEMGPQIEALMLRIDRQDMWQIGLVKLCFVQEFRFWQMVGRHQQKTMDNLTDEQRDHAAATAAMDYLEKAMPEAIRDEIREYRDNYIEMLMDTAGHLPRIN